MSPPSQTLPAIRDKAVCAFACPRCNTPGKHRSVVHCCRCCWLYCTMLHCRCAVGMGMSMKTGGVCVGSSYSYRYYARHQRHELTRTTKRLRARSDAHGHGCVHPADPNHSGKAASFHAGSTLHSLQHSHRRSSSGVAQHPPPPLQHSRCYCDAALDFEPFQPHTSFLPGAGLPVTSFPRLYHACLTPPPPPPSALLLSNV
jgi:hypothetical protein